MKFKKINESRYGSIKKNESSSKQPSPISIVVSEKQREMRKLMEHLMSAEDEIYTAMTSADRMSKYEDNQSTANSLDICASCGKKALKNLSSAKLAIRDLKMNESSKKIVKESFRGRDDGNSKVKTPIWTIELEDDTDYDNPETITPMNYCVDYESYDDAYDAANKLAKEYSDDPRPLSVRIMYGEYKLPSGDIYGEPDIIDSIPTGKDWEVYESTTRKSIKESNDAELVNDEESGSRLYEIGLWWGSGYVLDTYLAYAFSAEEALNHVVAYVEKTHPQWLKVSDECAKDMMKEYDEESPEFQEMFTYVDATMEGADEPHFIWAENLRIEDWQEGYDTYEPMDEAIDGGKFDIKKTLKENGIKKIPSKASIYNDRLEFIKRKGYSGEKTIDAMLEQVRDAGWTKGGETSGMSADGSSAGSGDQYISPDGQLKFSCTKYYGSTSYSNYFSFTFKRI